MTAREFVANLLDMAARAGRPVTAWFRTGRRLCSPTCEGYHPRQGLRAYPDGTLEHVPSVYGHHSLILPRPLPAQITEQEAVRTAKRLLTEERNTSRNPFLGYIELLEAAEISEVWRC